MELAANRFWSLNIFYPDNCEDYKNFEQLLKQDNVSNTLKDNNINVFTAQRDDIEKPVAYLYNQNMLVVEKFMDLNMNLVHKIISIVNPNPAQQKQKGGDNSYKHKYEKYKSKYNMMKGIVTKLT
jgi:hypothetical protein